MQITKHARERYVERIKLIRDKNEIKQYIAQNEEMIDDHINKLYKYANLVYTGQIGGDKTTKDFYLSGDICLVVDETCIRTIYIINFAFPEKTRLMVISDLKNEIVKMQSEIEIETTVVDSKRAELDCQISNRKREIAELKEQINIKEDEIKIYDAEKALVSKQVRYKSTVLQNYAEQLLGNTEYKKDISV